MAATSIVDADFARRRFLERFVGTFLGVNLLTPIHRLAAEPARSSTNSPTATSVIFLYLRGGLSHIDTFDPKPGRREMAGVKTIETSVPGVLVSEWFPQMAKQMHRLSLVRSMTSTQGIHDRGNYLAHTSYFMTPTIAHPSLGTWVVRRIGSHNTLLPGNVLINGSPQHPGAGFMESHLAPLPIVDPAAGLLNSQRPTKITDADFARRTNLAQQLGRQFVERTPHRDAAAYRQIQASAIELMKSKDLQVFDTSRESAATQAAYGSHTFGQGCLLARRLIEQGVRFVEVEDDQNWDTHNDQVVSMKRMTPSADQTMAALLADLDERGLLEKTLVVMATEFGRTPQINEVTDGRGHHPAVFTWWLAGGGVKRGFVYGRSDDTGERVAENAVSMPDINATIAHTLGIDLKEITNSPSGRPFTIAHQGQPVTALLA